MGVNNPGISRIGRECGASYVEFVVLVGLMVASVQGAISMGNLLSGMVALSQSAYSAALIGAEMPQGSTSSASMSERANMIMALNSRGLVEQENGSEIGWFSRESFDTNTGEQTVSVGLRTDVKRVVMASISDHANQGLVGPLLLRSGANAGDLSHFENPSGKYYDCAGNVVSAPRTCLTDSDSTGGQDDDDRRGDDTGITLDDGDCDSQLHCNFDW